MYKITILLILLFFVGATTSTQNVPVNTGSKITQEDAQAALNFHNKIRQDVDVEPLEWSVELSKFAQEWADYLSTNGCKIKHRPHEGQYTQKYGENIYWGGGGEYTCAYASQRWYSEIKDYRYGILTEDIWHKTGHYTQMVWRRTTKLGMGISKCSDGSTIIVANYFPPGNTIDELPY
jgi:pathogenesis-related protein 1